MKRIFLHSPYEVKAAEIIEIWKFAGGLITKKIIPEDITTETLKDIVRGLRKDIIELKNKI